jgi:NADH:ubiquinone oxidoreductase subunit E
MLSSVCRHSLTASFSHVVHRAVLLDGSFAFKSQAKVDSIFSKYPPDRKQAAIIPLLHLAQEENGYLNRGCIEAVAKLTDSQIGRVHETATFYHMFRFTVPRKHTLERCNGLSCYLHKSDAFKSAIETATKGTFKAGGSSDGEFDLIEVECLGACASAPVVVVDGTYYPTLKLEDVPTLVGKIRKGEDVTNLSVLKSPPPRPLNE